MCAGESHAFGTCPIPRHAGLYEATQRKRPIANHPEESTEWTPTANLCGSELAREGGSTYIPGLKAYAVHDKEACSRSAEQLPIR
ncbi:hypothetical protein EMIT043CA1_80274 [Pseudomonas brassicacearum]